MSVKRGNWEELGGVTCHDNTSLKIPSFVIKRKMYVGKHSFIA
jgi:hypothetical protein